MINLWPVNTTEVPPLLILLAQASMFNKEFGMAVWANYDEVNRSLGIANDTQNVTLLSIDTNQYPCKLSFDGTIQRARTEAEFIGLVAKVLNHQKTKLAIAELFKK